MPKTSTSTQRQWLYLKPLPKAEYTLLKAIVKRYSLKDDSEAVLIALRLLYEVRQFKDGQGNQWIVNIINEYRTDPNAERSYVV